jgi:spermidine/putrescine transport system permease protein
MIGNVIQSEYLVIKGYPVAAALSFVLMALILVVVLVYIRFAGSESLMGDEASPSEVKL